jgi:hypothetical protein
MSIKTKTTCHQIMIKGLTHVSCFNMLVETATNITFIPRVIWEVLQETGFDARRTIPRVEIE